MVPAQRGAACSATWDTGKACAAPNHHAGKPWTLTCADGDPLCDLDGALNGRCVVGLSACALQATARCAPERLTRYKIRGGTKRFKGLGAPDTSVPDCGSPGVATVALKRRGGRLLNESATLKLSIHFRTVPGGRGRNTLLVECVPPIHGDVSPPAGHCPNDPERSGTPKEVVLRVSLGDGLTNSNGSDLDIGWTGASHNLSIPGGASLRYCLSGCDGLLDTLCEASGETGPDTMNGEFFGAPVPMLVAGVPVCVVNRFQPGPITGALDVATGEANLAGEPLAVDLVTEAYLRVGHDDEICPRCEVPGGCSVSAPGKTGVCSPTALRPGQPCVVDGFVRVAGGANDPSYTVSRDCTPPRDASNPSVVATPLRLTTGAATSPAGPNPCPGQTRPDSCPDGGACTATCTDCASRGSSGECIDVKGGIAQRCCSSDPRRSCFPTASGAPITRYGMPGTSRALFAAVLCLPAAPASSHALDSAVGLPGPAALLLPADPVTVLHHVP